MFTKQRKYQQPKCLHIITCLVFSSLVLVLQWQTTQATPIIATKAAASSSSSSTTTTTTARRLRNHEKPDVRADSRDDAGVVPCEHKSLSELIKTSPVILKALGAHIFNHDDDEDLRILHNSNDALLLKWQNEQNKVLTTFKRTASAKNVEQTKQQQTFGDAATNRAAILASMNADAILITLTPETIYKGASLLKMTPNAAEHASLNSQTTDTSSGPSNGFSSSNTIASTSGDHSNAGNSANGSGASLNSGTINSSEASYSYEGQLNATVQPLSCFDENLLKMLPSDLIIFGKLITTQEQQQKHDDFIMAQHDYTASSSSSSSVTHEQQQQQSGKDVLKISINGLHRWSSQFENYIWKHLGWDDWSDFTVCSVACGRGVQQRFRRCLFDNPMVNLNMNFNDEEDNGDDVDDVELEEDYNDAMLVDDEISEQHNTIDVVVDSDDDDDGVSGGIIAKTVAKTEAVNSKYEHVTTTTTPPTTTDVNHHPLTNDNVLATTDTLITGNMLHFVTTAKTDIRIENSTTTEEPEVMRIFEGHFNDTFSERTSASTSKMNNETSFPTHSSAPSAKCKKQQIKHRKHKSAKLYSTMFCEGYNIEQRNCNSFECSDDINDLLKFYRKYAATDEINAASTQAMIMDLNTAASSSSLPSSASSISGTIAAVPTSTMTNEMSSSSSSNTETNYQNSNTFTTINNMGFIQNWHNPLNFTIMLTIRHKNDSCTAATIFSIRNSTHNLYLESCKDGLRLYLERDKTTEMLPIKFNLYDYHWHQVAISIQNGDFISIYVDCSWTNSFVVSKRLFSLPIEADVEIARGFNGELQQLLILPEHQERYQCSDKRISINEVKRYIIDTFIDDYGN